MTWQSIVLYFIILLIMLYVMTCLGYLVFHRYFIIFPSRMLSTTPSDYQLQYEEVFFSTRDNVLLQGWFITGNPAEEWNAFTVILFSGNKGTISDFLLQAKHLSETGFNVFLFSYRGFGKSQRKWPTENGVYKDSKAACEYLLKEKNIPVNNILFLGQSLGCAMASFAALSFDPRALILEGGFPSVAEVAARAVKWLPLKLLTMSRFESKKYIKKVTCPVLIIHSNEDKAIPLSDAENLFSTVTGKKNKVIIKGPHAKGLEYDSKTYLYEIINFIRTIG